MFLTRIAEMTDKGFTLAESLDFLGRMHDRHLSTFQKMIDGLQSGEPIHRVFHQLGFDRQACSQLFFAEKHGFITTAMKESGNYLLRKDEQRKKLFRLLQYPFILLLILLLVGFLLHHLLLPRFQLFYDSMDYKPNLALKWFLHIMQTFPYYVTFAFLMAGCVFLVTSRILHSKSALDRALFFSGTPFIHSYYKLYQTIFISREWSFLLKSGFSINEIIEIMLTQPFHPLLKESAAEIRSMLKTGYSFSEALIHLGFLEEEMIEIVAHGEKNGKLDSELLFYSEFCLLKLEEKTMRVFTFLQPVIFLLIGLIVIAIYLSIFLPMFQIIDSI
ncbi:competence type IV pilus assembly protein ComGB [Siminovitchia sp. 179-K 8D1 HS]|uniref:competence type IV pilus assembly protein ComGB n=1 Tax=Siminovitchia sp. 179-K 8D1 HS TaxID=3142385 RepID=UPI0039A183B4